MLSPPVTTERKAAVTLHRSQLGGNLLSLFAKSDQTFAEVADGKSILAKHSLEVDVSGLTWDFRG